MKAIGVRKFFPISDVNSIEEFDAPIPSCGDYDVIVEVKAVGFNPVDTKQRATIKNLLDTPRILGWDASGVIVSKGKSVEHFQLGDEVYYAGDVTRAGCNAQFQAVDSRIIAKKPKTLTHARAAAMPLCSITAWEGMIEGLQIQSGKNILIIGGAGGVGSVAIQIAKNSGLKVAATASRDVSKKWCETLGADAVIDHKKNLLEEWSKLGWGECHYIANFVNTEMYWELCRELIAPLGGLLLIVEPMEKLTLGDPLKAKCAKIVWEFMFARSKSQTSCMAKQGEILTEMAELIDQQKIKSTLSQNLGRISCETVRKAHAILESHTAIGKLVAEW